MSSTRLSFRDTDLASAIEALKNKPRQTEVRLTSGEADALLGYVLMVMAVGRANATIEEAFEGDSFALEDDVLDRVREGAGDAP